MDIRESRELIPNKTLQGNLDPCVLYSPFSEVEKQTKAMVQAFGKERYIANLGHGVYPDTDPEKVKCFIETVKAC
jgi:uroporphyrinogen decarboxylase